MILYDLYWLDLPHTFLGVDDTFKIIIDSECYIYISLWCNNITRGSYYNILIIHVPAILQE